MANSVKPDSVPGTELVVVGSVNQDSFVYLQEFPRPGQTVLALSAAAGLGGKGANQAIAAARLGIRVSFVGQVGSDAAGDTARTMLASESIDVTGLRSHETAPTGIAHITVDATGENTVAVHGGANRLVDAQAVAESVSMLRVERLGRSAPSVILAQGELPATVVEHAAQVARDLGARFLLNLAPAIEISDDIIAMSDPLVVNEGEAAELLARHDRTIPGTGVELAEVLFELYGTAIVVTLGAEGAAIASGGAVVTVPSPAPTRVVDTTGAGDAFVGALAAGLCRGLNLTDAVRLGTAAGSHAVAAEGTTTSYPSAADLPALPLRSAVTVEVAS